MLEESDLDEIEKLVRSGIFQQILPASTKLEEFYGPFHAAVESFSFLRGFRKVLMNISAYICDKGSENIGKTTILTQVKNTKGLKRTIMTARTTKAAQTSSHGTNCVHSIILLYKL